MPRWSVLILTGLLFFAPLSGCVDRRNLQRTKNAAGGASLTRLNTILQRGTLICGVHPDLPGFSFIAKDGRYRGLDVDICRAVAAALFNDPDAVEFRPLNTKERFSALQSGEIDLLSRNTTWSLSRDTDVGLEFAPIVFYDGQGIMVTQASGVKSLKDLQGKSICVQTGTTTEKNLADQMAKQGISYTPLVFEDIDTTFAAYAQGRCQGITTDRSQLAGRRSILPQPEQHLILDTVISKEPLAPAVVNGDNRWFDVVKWVVFALFNAEELEVNSENVTQIAANTKDPVLRRFLGVEGNLGSGMGLSQDFALRVIKNVGNYGEIYERNLGAKTPLNLPRGINKPWTKGGLMYSPPFL